jgi:hypothetical protein
MSARKVEIVPKLQVRKPEQVPGPVKASRAVQEQHRLYEGFIRDVGAGRVGELQLESNEPMRSVKVRLRRAASRLGVKLEIWDADSRVYFKPATKRGRSKRQAGKVA